MARILLCAATAALLAVAPAGGASPECVEGGDANDRLVGTDAADCLRGHAGDDLLEGLRGADLLDGGEGADHLEGGWGRDQLIGGLGDDLIGGGQEASVIHAGPGNDAISSSNGARDLIDCGDGRDHVRADRGDRFTGCERVRYVVSPYGTVSPRSGGPRTAFTLTFRALYRADRHARYVVGLAHGRSSRRGCQASGGQVIERRISPGETVQVRLDVGRPWCPALYRGVLRYIADGGRNLRLGRFFFRVRG